MQPTDATPSLASRRSRHSCQWHRRSGRRAPDASRISLTCRRTGRTVGLTQRRSVPSRRWISQRVHIEQDDGTKADHLDEIHRLPGRASQHPCMMVHGDHICVPARSGALNASLTPADAKQARQDASSVAAPHLMAASYRYKQDIKRPQPSPGYHPTVSDKMCRHLTGRLPSTRGACTRALIPHANASVGIRVNSPHHHLDPTHTKVPHHCGFVF